MADTRSGGPEPAAHRGPSGGLGAGEEPGGQIELVLVIHQPIEALEGALLGESPEVGAIPVEQSEPDLVSPGREGGDRPARSGGCGVSRGRTALGPGTRRAWNQQQKGNQRTHWGHGRREPKGVEEDCPLRPPSTPFDRLRNQAPGMW